MDEEMQLVQAAAEGEAKAVRSLYDRHAGHLYAVVRRLAGDDVTAEDWAQEAWLRVFRALPTFRGDAQFSTWAHRIAVNVALNGRRRQGLQADRIRSLDEIPEPSSPQDQPVLRIGIQRAVDNLPNQMRRVLVLHDMEGFTHVEIADMLGVTVGTCKSQLFKARAKLREVLKSAEHTIEEQEICNT